MGSETNPSRPQTRREAARVREEMAVAAARQEAKAAQRLIDEFIVQARQEGITPQPLRAQLISGGTAKTDQIGWYIKANQSVAIGEDGSYYVLTVHGGLKEKMRGVHLAPSQPGLVVSRGGRDGESGDLKQFLDARLGRGW